MRHLCRILLAATVVGLVASDASAQFYPASRDPYGRRVQVYTFPDPFGGWFGPSADEIDQQRRAARRYQRALRARARAERAAERREERAAERREERRAAQRRAARVARAVSPALPTQPASPAANPSPNTQLGPAPVAAPPAAPAIAAPPVAPPVAAPAAAPAIAAQPAARAPTVAVAEPQAAPAIQPPVASPPPVQVANTPTSAVIDPQTQTPAPVVKPLAPPALAPAVSAPPSLPSAAARVAPIAGRVVPGELLVVLKPGVDPVEGSRLARRHRLRFMATDTIALINATIARVRVTDQASAAAMADIATDDRVAAVLPNRVYALPDDRTGAAAPTPQEALDQFALGDARRLATGVDVRIAIVDSGIDTQHPALAGRVDASVDEIAGLASSARHGTAIAGLIAGRVNAVGIAPDAQLLDLRAFADGYARDDGAAGSTIQILHALDDAQTRGARLALLGFSGPSDELIQQALAAGRDKSMIFIAPAMRGDAAGALAFPASDPNVIAIAATGGGGRPSPEAARGVAALVAAPGTDLLAPAPGNAYARVSGASFAAAQVTGLSALLLQIRPDLDFEGLKALLTKTAHRTAPAVEAFGAGIVDAKAAVDLAAGQRDEQIVEGDPRRGRSIAGAPQKDGPPP